MAKLIRDRYEPLESIGRGGQGEVLRAIDRQHDRVVAIKVRPAGTAAQRTALLSEARILLGLRPHPNLPLIREDFFLRDRYYLVMDWIAGENLHVALRSRGVPGLPFEGVVESIEAAAEALDHLHAHNPPIVHGDVKPANLIESPSGEIVLVDFGIARSGSPAAVRIAGTSGYTAPEVAAGAPPTPASDRYSLAATAVALLSGRPPDGLKPEWNGIPPAAVPALERVLFPALSIDASRRPATAKAFAADLRRAFGLSPRRPAMRRVARAVVRAVPPRRRPVWAAAIVAVTAIVLTMPSVRLGPPVGGGDRVPEQPRPRGSDATTTTSPRSSPAGTAPARASASASARPSAVGSPARPQTTPPDTGWRGAPIAYEHFESGRRQIWIMRGDGSPPRRLASDPATNASSNWDPKWSPDGRRLAFTSDRRGRQDVFVINSDGSGLRRLTDSDYADHQPEWSPDGRHIVYTRWGAEGRPRLVVVDATRGERGGLRFVTAGDVGWEGEASWSPNGRTIAFTAQVGDIQRDIFVIAADAQGEVPTRLTSWVGLDVQPAWSADGNKIAFISNRSGGTEVHVMDTGRTDTQGTRQVTSFSHAGQPAWTPDGSIVLHNSTLAADIELWLVDSSASLATNGRRLTWSAGDDTAADIAW